MKQANLNEEILQDDQCIQTMFDATVIVYRLANL